MAEILLFHHAQGLTPGIRELAGTLRAASHTVHAPDLFDGLTFDSIDAGLAHVQEHGGFGALLDRGTAIASTLPEDVVYLGFSLGVVPAQNLAQTRPGCRGAVLCYSCVPTSEFGGWPDGVPAQVHGMDHDPIFVGEGDLEAARALVEESGTTELFLYPGDQHYFADSSLPGYDPAATELMVSRILAMLDR